MESVTFIIPVRRKKPFLQKVLRAIRDQDYQGTFEIIVVDNSRFGFRLNEPGVKLIRCRKKGPSAARNMGAENSSSDLICFVDSDVVLESNWLTECHAELKKFHGISATQAPVETGFLNTESPSFLDRYREAFRKWRTKGTYIYASNGGVLLNTAAVLVRRSAFEKVVGFEEKLLRAEDFHFTLKLIYTGYFISATNRTKSRVFHTEGILRYVLKYFGQGRAEAGLALIHQLRRPKLDPLIDEDRNFRRFRFLCQLFFAFGTRYKLPKIENIPIKANKLNVILGISPHTRVVYTPNQLHLLEVKRNKMFLIETKNFDWKFPLVFEQNIARQLEQEGLIILEKN